ncbi:glycoside hydrolase family 3 N-terminal domain-containing protein [Oceanibium sediminis]|uniref:glycoside hydrolase family 3 N-terminal domain-containing protein n=1 Tax=Oceanibium sediminis TaxID=2026339 RepID=UPI000DD46915|nr:glycoside hydrolase family 3 protein [Oceanibium sediminis]
MAPRAAILGCLGQTLGASEAAFFRDADPWGFILFARNLSTPDQIRALVADLRDAVGRNAPVLIDQEGGRVARLPPPVWTGWENALDFMTGLPDGADAALAMRLRYHVIADELRALGIDVNCAPMADLALPDTHPLIRHRCYGEDPATVARIGRAVAEGLLAGGVLPVLKHIPGHGRTALDSHKDLPRVSTPLETLRAEDFAPFRALADLPLGMTAHIVYDALDPERPATLSPKVIAEVRGNIGFGGLLMTDDLSMGALSGTFGARCEQAIAAGCDLVLHCNGDPKEMAAVADATPRLAGAAQERAARALSVRDGLSPAPLDIPGALSRIKKELGHA